MRAPLLGLLLLLLFAAAMPAAVVEERPSGERNLAPPGSTIVAAVGACGGVAARAVTADGALVAGFLLREERPDDVSFSQTVCLGRVRAEIARIGAMMLDAAQAVIALPMWLHTDDVADLRALLGNAQHRFVRALTAATMAVECAHVASGACTHMADIQEAARAVRAQTAFGVVAMRDGGLFDERMVDQDDSVIELSEVDPWAALGRLDYDARVPVDIRPGTDFVHVVLWNGQGSAADMTQKETLVSGPTLDFLLQGALVFSSVAHDSDSDNRYFSVVPHSIGVDDGSGVMLPILWRNMLMHNGATRNVTLCESATVLPIVYGDRRLAADNVELGSLVFSLPRDPGHVQLIAYVDARFVGSTIVASLAVSATFMPVHGPQLVLDTLFVPNLPILDDNPDAELVYDPDAASRLDYICPRMNPPP